MPILLYLDEKNLDESFGSFLTVFDPGNEKICELFFKMLRLAAEIRPHSNSALAKLASVIANMLDRNMDFLYSYPFPFCDFFKCMKEGVNNGTLGKETLTYLKNGRSFDELTALMNDDLQWLQTDRGQPAKMPESESIEVPLDCAAAFFGAEKCYQFLNGKKRTLKVPGNCRWPVSNIARAAVAGGSLAIVKSLASRGVVFKNAADLALKYHRKNIFLWIKAQYDKGWLGRKGEIEAKCIEYGNLEMMKMVSEGDEREIVAKMIARCSKW